MIWNIFLSMYDLWCKSMCALHIKCENNMIDLFILDKGSAFWWLILYYFIYISVSVYMTIYVFHMEIILSSSKWILVFISLHIKAINKSVASYLIMMNENINTNKWNILMDYNNLITTLRFKWNTIIWLITGMHNYMVNRTYIFVQIGWKTMSSDINKSICN